MTVDAEGKVLASASWDCSVRVFDLRNGNEIGVYTGHKKPVNSVSFHPDGQTILSGSWDGLISTIYHLQQEFSG